MDDSTHDLKPKSHRERVAIFRASVVGALVCRDLARGELKSELERLAEERFRPPGSKTTRRYGFSTLERWYYAYKNDGLAGLMPKTRSDRGHARALGEQTRRLLCDIRTEYPRASVPLILRTLQADGRLGADVVSPSTVRRLFRRQGLTRSTGLEDGARQRLRWQAASPMALWQGDVCHGPQIAVDGVGRPMRVHALIDDASRYVVALEAHHTEQEVDMLGLFADALRRWGRPKEVYLDNGSTYSGDALEAVCTRLGVGLRHTAPYDPEAKGKVERFFRTLQAQCVDYLGGAGSLEAVNVRLNAWLDQHYHHAPHAGLMGRAPAAVFGEGSGEIDRPSEADLNAAFMRRITRKVRADSTLSIDGECWEVDQRFLCSRTVTVCRPLLDDAARPHVEMEGRRFELHPVDVHANGRRRRASEAQTSADEPVDFQPADALMRRAAGRPPKHHDNDQETM